MPNRNFFFKNQHDSHVSSASLCCHPYEQGQQLFRQEEEQAYWPGQPQGKHHGHRQSQWQQPGHLQGHGQSQWQQPGHHQGHGQSQWQQPGHLQGHGQSQWQQLGHHQGHGQSQWQQPGHHQGHGQSQWQQPGHHQGHGHHHSHYGGLGGWGYPPHFGMPVQYGGTPWQGFPWFPTGNFGF